MKFVKILSLILALLMIGSVMIACGDSGSETNETESQTEQAAKKIKVNIHVRRTENGDDVYDSGAYGYTFEGETCTVAKIVEEFMLFGLEDESFEVTYDEDGKIKAIGEIEAGVGQFWMFSLAKAPKGVAQAEPVDANIETYDKIEEDDTIVIYLGGLVE